MRGYGLFFIAACMALVAASAGVILYFTAGMAALEASVIALAILFALMVLEVSAGRRRDRAEFSARFEALSRASVDIARQVAELRHNVAAIAANPMRPAPAPAPDPKHKSKPAGEPADHDIGDLAQVVEDLAQTVAVHEALLAARAEMKPPEPVAVEIESADFAPVEPSSPEPADAAETTAPFQAGSTDVTSDGARIGLVREAVAAGRIDLYLQPVVTLPQRKVRYYEALSRMRLADGEVIGAADFLPAAKAAGLLPRID
jgi:cyclic-di-GMP phosphodiesterase TipF (flagellum assembly factor)